MRVGRNRWIALVAAFVVLAGAAALYLIFFRPVWALEFFYKDTYLEDFNAGYFYHTALSLRGNGEVQLLPIGLGQPWQPGNNTGLPNRAGAGVVYYDDHIYVSGGDSSFGQTWNDVYYTEIYTDVLTLTERLADWITTTALPAAWYPEGLYRHESVAWNGYLYVFGGLESKGGADTYYDTVVFAQIQPDGSLGDWEATFPLPQALFDLESVVLSDRIYIFGGADDHGNSTSAVYFAEPNPATGEIASWTPTTSLPPLEPGGYAGSAVALLNNRFYIYGGTSNMTSPDYSYFVHYAEPFTPTGAIPEWHFINDQPLPQNCYASEGAAYESGLLLAVAGAWNNVADPSGDVRVTLVDLESGWTGEWVSTVGLDPGRFWHSVVQDGQGWLYSIGGSTGSTGDRLNEVQMVPPYSGGGGGAQGRTTELIYRTQETTTTTYAPDGFFRSQTRELIIAEAPAKLKSLAWNTTITDPTAMTITMSYRYRKPDQTWTEWVTPSIPSDPGPKVTTSMAISGTCEYFQYRAFFATSVPTQTPLLNNVRIGVLAPPDLVADELSIAGCSTSPCFVMPNELVQIEFTTHNRSTALQPNNNFFAMAFIKDTPDPPSPPDCPVGCDCSDPGSCPLIWPLQGYNFPETGDPVVMTTTWTFHDPGTYYLVAYVDYNDTPAEPAPFYDVHEFDEYNNYLVLTVKVGIMQVYLPLIFK